MSSIEADLLFHREKGGVLPEVLTNRGWVRVDELIVAARREGRVKALEDVEDEVTRVVGEAASMCEEMSLKVKKLDQIRDYAETLTESNGVGSFMVVGNYLLGLTGPGE